MDLFYLIAACLLWAAVFGLALACERLQTADLWGVLGALASIVLPLALAGWLLARPVRRAPRPSADPREKMLL